MGAALSLLLGTQATKIWVLYPDEGMILAARCIDMKKRDTVPAFVELSFW